MRRRARTVVPALGFLWAIGGLAWLAGEEAKKTEHVEVPKTAPRSEDVGTIDGMVKAYYEVITGPPTKPREWSRDRTLYISDLRFVAMGVDKAGAPEG